MTLRAMIRILVVALLALVAVPATALAGPAPRDDTSRPLVYVFVVDGLDGDAVEPGQPTPAPFLSSLLAGQGARSTYYRESRSIMVAETNPNHVAMATGAYGNASGIPGNDFAVYGTPSRPDGCPTPGTIDESRPPTAVSGETPACVVAETFFQTVARSPFPARVTTAGIFGKPKLGRLMAARRANGTLEADYLWAPCEDEDDDPSYCADVPTNPVTGYALDDGIVMDEVLRSVREGVPADGARKRPNLTFVNLQQVDTVGHAFGRGPAYDGTVTQADDQIERFVARQRALGLWPRTVMIVLSDHSMDSTPVRSSLALTRFTPAGIDPDDYTIVQNGSTDLVYLNDRTSPGRFALLRRMRAAALGTIPAPLPLPGPPGPLAEVDEALYRQPNPADGGAQHTLATRHPGWRIDGPRTGDLLVTHKPGGAFSDPVNPLNGNHGGPQTLDNFFAVIGGGRGVRQATRGGTVGARFDDTLLNPRQAENVDVAPTVMRLLGRRAPLDSSGRFLAEAFDLAAIPGGGRPVALAPRIVLTVTPRAARVGRSTRFVFRARAGLPAGTAPCAARSAAQAAGCAQRTAKGTLRATAGATVTFAGRTARTNARGIAVITTTLRSTGRRVARATRPDLRPGFTSVRGLRRPTGGFTGRG